MQREQTQFLPGTHWSAIFETYTLLFSTMPHSPHNTLTQTFVSAALIMRRGTSRGIRSHGADEEGTQSECRIGSGTHRRCVVRIGNSAGPDRVRTLGSFHGLSRIRAVGESTDVARVKTSHHLRRD